METKSPVTAWQFIGTALVCAAILVCANLVVAGLTRHTVSKRILADARNSGNARTVALGNSLMRSGFVTDEFAPPGPEWRSTALNMAMGASSPAEHLLLLRAAIRSNPRARLLLYGYYDFQLTDTVQFRYGDLIGNHDLLYFQEPTFARQYYALGKVDSAAFEISRRVALLSERGAVWARVERLRRLMAQQEMPGHAANQFGRVADFTLLEASSTEEFVRHCETGSLAPLNSAVSEIIREARGQNMQVTFILMPLPLRHIESFYDTPAWQVYQQHVRSLLAENHVTVLDASRWITARDQFGDAMHLTASGAAEFSRLLARHCRVPDSSFGCGE